MGELEDVAEEIVATETKQDGNKQDCKQDTKSISEYMGDEEKICKTDDVNEKVELESFNEAEESKDQKDSNETQTHTCADDPYCSSSKTEENKETEVEISDNKNLVSSEVEEEKDHDEASAEKVSSDVEETESSPEGKDKVSLDLKDEGCLPSTEEKVPQNGSEPHIEKEVQDDKNIDLKEQINEDNGLSGKEETKADTKIESILIEKEDKQEIALITNGCSTKLTSMVAHQVVDDHSKVPETEIDTINSETITSGEKQAEIIEANVVDIKVEESTPQIVCDQDEEDGESKEKCDQDTIDDTQHASVKDCFS